MVPRFHRAPAFSGSARFPSGDISHRLSGDTLHLMCPRGRLFVPPLRKVAPSRLLGLLPGSALAPRSDTRLSSPGVTEFAASPQHGQRLPHRLKGAGPPFRRRLELRPRHPSHRRRARDPAPSALRPHAAPPVTPATAPKSLVLTDTLPAAAWLLGHRASHHCPPRCPSSTSGGATCRG